MVLVDTSVWINHLHAGNTKLEALLMEAEVVSHPFVVGELACGNIRNRKEVFSLLDTLPLTQVVTDYEFRHFLERNKLMGKGIGFIDIHLLASARISRVPLWTEVKQLSKVARKLNLSYT
jgi:predicted nucleic acid-binding protein